MAKAGASASGSSARAARGVPVAPRGSGQRSFKRPALKTSRPPEEDDAQGQLSAIAAKKAAVKAEMILQGKPQADIDHAMRKIDEEFKRKLQPKQEDMPELEMGGGADDVHVPDEPQQDDTLAKAMILMPRPARKKGLPTIFGSISERGLRVPPVAPEDEMRRKLGFKREKPSILAMQNARTPLKAANTSKAPGLGARGGFAASGARGGFSGGPAGGPSGASGGPR